MTPEQLQQQNEIIEKGTSEQAYCFAKDVLGADIAALQQVVLQRGSSYDVYLFARNVPGANIDEYRKIFDEWNKKVSY